MAAVWIGGIITLFVSSVSGGRNNDYQPQNEFKLENWVNLGVFSINKAVLYLFLAAIATCVSMIYVATACRRDPTRCRRRSRRSTS